MHYYQHHIGDFIKATARLSDSQCMAYLRLIWMYYDSEKPLKADARLLAFQVGAPEQDVELILQSFFLLQEDGWHQTRCDQEIADYHVYLEKKANAGRASAERRKNNSSTGVQQVLSESSTVEQHNHKPLTTNQEPSTNVVAPKRRKQLPDDFYPDHTGLNAAGQKGVDVAVELQKFRDYHSAKGSVMLDWQAAWRTWVGNVRFAPATVSKQSALEARNAEVARRFLASQEGV
jgi:uncharacterized protein YdaU (DUF1376 family)